jgi:hypothetical protein
MNHTDHANTFITVLEIGKSTSIKHQRSLSNIVPTVNIARSPTAKKTWVKFRSHRYCHINSFLSLFVNTCLPNIFRQDCPIRKMSMINLTGVCYSGVKYSCAEIKRSGFNLACISDTWIKYEDRYCSLVMGAYDANNVSLFRNFVVLLT